jgi:hypothetical protein
VGAAPREVLFAPPTRGAAEGAFVCLRETAGIFLFRGSTVAGARDFVSNR